MLLLDTHVWLWLAEGSKVFQPKIQDTIREAVRQDELFLCPISL